MHIIRIDPTHVKMCIQAHVLPFQRTLSTYAAPNLGYVLEPRHPNVITLGSVRNVLFTAISSWRMHSKLHEDQLHWEMSSQTLSSQSDSACAKPSLLPHRTGSATGDQ